MRDIISNYTVSARQCTAYGVHLAQAFIGALSRAYKPRGGIMNSSKSAALSPCYARVGVQHYACHTPFEDRAPSLASRVAVWHAG